MGKALDFFTSKAVLIVFSIIAVVVAVVSFNYYQSSQKKLNKLTQNPQEAAREQVRDLINKVGRLMALPAGEDPVIATITDVNKLKEQPFFAKAKNGDKVLIFAKAKRAILYRPDINKVVDIAPVNIGTNSAGQVAGVKDEEKTPSPTPTPEEEE